MTVQSTDLLLVQRANQPFRATAENLADFANGTIDVETDIGIASASELGTVRVGPNLAIDPSTGILSAVIPSGLTYKGSWALADTVPDPVVNGDFYIWDGGNDVTLDNASWGTINGSTISDNDRLFYDNVNQWEIGPTGSGGGITGVSGTAPIVVDSTTDPTTPDISISPASDSSAGSMSSSDFNKLDGIEAGAQINVAPSQGYTNAPDGGTLTLAPGGDTTLLPIASTTNAGLLSAADKVTLDGLSSNPSGVSSVTAGTAIDITGTPAVPVVNVIFGAAPNGTPEAAMPYDISALGDLP